MNIRVTEDEYLQWNEFNVNWKLCLCFLFTHWWIDLILNTWAEGDRMYKYTKHCTCPVEISVEFLCSVTTPPDCRKTAQISSSHAADKSRMASVKPCLWHYDLYCKLSVKSWSTAPGGSFLIMASFLRLTINIK